jgi:hypothetical protein
LQWAEEKSNKNNNFASRTGFIRAAREREGESECKLIVAVCLCVASSCVRAAKQTHVSHTNNSMLMAFAMEMLLAVAKETDKKCKRVK